MISQALRIVAKMILAPVFFSALLLAQLPLASAADLPACREQWAALIPANQHKYDYASDARQQRGRGNFGYSKYKERTRRQECRKDWAVLVYMAADNNLFPYALWDLYEMEAGFASAKNAAGSTLKADLLVQIDTKGRSGLRRLHIFETPETYSVKSLADFQARTLADVRSPVVENAPEPATEAEKFRSFLEWARANYPADHYMVVVWGHGQGWKAYAPGEKPGKDFGGIGLSQTSGKRLDIPAIRDALAAFNRAAGKEQLDVYASDACLMQMVEVAGELTSVSRFIVGSTQVQTFLGLPYRRLLYELNTGRFNGQRAGATGSVDADDEPYLLAKMIPELMRQSLHPELGSQGRSDAKAIRTITSSALSSANLARQLAPAMSDLGKALDDYLAEDPMRAMDLGKLLDKVPGFEGGAQDLGVFLGMLEDQLSLAARENGEHRTLIAARRSAMNARQALGESALSFAYGTDYGWDSNGRMGYAPRAVSVWLPKSPEEYEARRAEFLLSKFYRETSWSRWLDRLHLGR